MNDGKQSRSPHKHPSFDLFRRRAGRYLEEIDIAKDTARQVREGGGEGRSLTEEEEEALKRDLYTALLGERLVEIQRAGLAYRIGQLSDDTLDRVDELYRRTREEIDASLDPESRRLVRAAQGFGAWIERLYAEEPFPDLRGELLYLIERSARRSGNPVTEPEEGKE